MDLQLTGKRVLITAGHKGIGYRIAYRMLEEDRKSTRLNSSH